MRFIIFIFFLIPLIAGADEIIEISFDAFGMGSYLVSTPRTVYEKAMRATAERFEELHPNIKLKPFISLKIQGAPTEVGPLLAIAGGISPDILYVNFRRSKSYYKQEFLHPLDKYVEEWKKRNPSEVEEAIYPRLWPHMSYKNHIYAIPWFGAMGMGILYRKDLFKEAGLNPERPPLNWDELYEYCKKLANPEKGIYGIGITSSSAWHFSNFLFCAGANITEEDEKGDGRAVFNTTEGATALVYFHKLIKGEWEKEGKKYKGVAYYSPDFYFQWQQGKIGMILSYLEEQSVVPGLDPALCGIAPLPLGPTGIRSGEFNSRMFGIYSGIKDKKRIDACWKFISFINSREARKIRAKIFVENGWAKYVNPKELRRFGFEKYISEVPKGWEETVEETLRTAKPEPSGKSADAMYGELNIPVQEAVLLDKIDLETAKKLLDKAAKRCNEKLFGHISIEELKKRKIIGSIVLVFAAIILVLFLYKGIKSFARSVHPIVEQEKSQKKKYLYAYILLIPAIFSIGLWAYYPLIRGSLMAFQDYSLTGNCKWIGINNFVEVLFTPLFWKSLFNSFYYIILFLGLGFFLPIFLAILLNEIPKGKIFFRVLYYLPAITTGIVVIILWKGFYDPSDAGFLNKILGIFKIPSQRWLNDPSLAMLCIIFPLIWVGTGPGCIMYLAGLKSIPEEVYEAADLDGAGSFKKIWYITLPYLKPLIIINFVGAFIGAFRSFEFVLTMTAGGPANATRVIGLEIWYDAYIYLRFGYAVSMAWLLGSLLIGFTVYQLKILSRLQFKTTQQG